LHGAGPRDRHRAHKGAGAVADTFIFLKVHGLEIQGESTAKGYEDQIEIESVDWKMTVPSAKEAGQATKVEYHHVTMEKFVDASTCTLLEWAKTRRETTDKEMAIPQMTITYVDMVLEKDGANKPLPVAEFMLHLCYIENMSFNVSDAGKGSVRLGETLTIRYDKIDMVYHPSGTDRLTRGKAQTFIGFSPRKFA
jgi:type VI secretion system Hcp family effector